MELKRDPLDEAMGESAASREFKKVFRGCYNTFPRSALRVPNTKDQREKIRVVLLAGEVSRRSDVRIIRIELVVVRSGTKRMSCPRPPRR